MNEFAFFINNVLVSGTVLGCIYALGAIGVTLIFGILRFAHFAHGDMMTMGAFVSFILAAIAASLGTQTGGSVIRPASFCGVVGYKPSFGLLPRTGVKAISDSFDTVGS